MLDISKIETPFSFLGSTIRSLRIQNHSLYLGEDTNESYGLKITLSDVSHAKEDSSFFGTVSIAIEIVITTKNDKKQDVISMVLDGGFTAPDSIGKETFEKLLKINGATMLYSIARGKVETITSAMFVYGNISLPVINVLRYYEEEQKAAAKAQNENREDQ